MDSRRNHRYSKWIPSRTGLNSVFLETVHSLQLKMTVLVLLFLLYSFCVSCRFLILCPTFDNMASKGLRVILYQVTRKVKAGCNLSHTTETLIGYIVCWRFVLFCFIFSQY